MKNENKEQIDIFSESTSIDEAIQMDIGSTLKVVKATFDGEIKADWEMLFDGFDYLYAITYSSGIDFVNKVVSKFKKSEIIFGCEKVIGSDFSVVIALQNKFVEKYAKRKSTKLISEKLADESLKLFVSRDTNSHEKIFVLSSDDGRYRVITGSANMSSTAFCGLQRENIVCFDDKNAYEYYKNIFDTFKDTCSDTISYKTIFAIQNDPEFLENNINETPVIKTANEKEYIFLESASNDDETELVASIKGFESELKPMLPKTTPKNGKIQITSEITKAFGRNYTENKEIQIAKEKKLPKLHLDFESSTANFNGKSISLTPPAEKIKEDISCLHNFFLGFETFSGNVEETQKSYFRFLCWYFASVFIPYLRLVGSKNGCDPVDFFPIFGIIYGDSNGGKTTFIKFLSRMMCGKKCEPNSNNDFTSSEIECLKRAREGLPIIIDDLIKQQFTNHGEKILKDDNWGLPERFVNYPAVVITTNALPSVKPQISKRAVICHIDSRINKEAGARNSRKIKESENAVSTAFFGEYLNRMFSLIKIMENKMRAEKDYFPDIFSISSNTICDLFEEFYGELPKYASRLTYTDYFGDKAIGKNALNKLFRAWEDEQQHFKIDRKTNKLIYYCSDSDSNHLLKYINDELPPSLEAQLNPKSLVMKLDEAEKLFQYKFKKKFSFFSH